MKMHPLAEQFPRMLPDEFDEMVADIKKNGCLNPIWTHEGMVLDGAHRYRACLAAGVKPPLREIDGMPPEDFVVSQNVLRRHLSQAQRALLIAPRYEEEKGKGGNTAELLASRYSIGASTISRAASIQRRHPDLAAQVLSGSMELAEAEEIARDRKWEGRRPLMRNLVEHSIPRLHASFWADSLRSVSEAARKGMYNQDKVRTMIKEIEEIKQREDALLEILHKVD